jgi:hypothetical protein
MGFYRGPRLVTDGLVLCLDAANTKSYPGTGTTCTDLSGNSNNGTLVNGVGYSTNNKGIFVFDGVDDYISIASTIVMGNSNTVSAFIKLSTSNTSTVIYCPLANMIDNWLGISNNRLLLYATETADINNFSLLGTTILDTTNTKWYYVTSTISNNVATIYVNGIQENTITKEFTIGSWSSGGDIGRRGGFSQTQYFNGMISNLQIYNRALTSNEILQNYNATKSRYGL